jgi:hypothetical protein
MKLWRTLKDKVEAFLKKYDYDGNEEIDIEELIEGREEFSEELGKIKKIIKATKELEKKAIDYKQGNLTEKKKGESKKWNDETKQKSAFKKNLAELKKEIKGVKNEIKVMGAKEEDKELEKQRNELEAQLEGYRQIEEQVKKQKELLSQKREQLIDKEEEEILNDKKIKELKIILSKIEIEISRQLNNIKRNIDGVKDDDKRKLARNKFVDLERQVKELGTTNYWKDKINQGQKEIKSFLEDSEWYWEQWKNRNLKVDEDDFSQAIKKSFSKSGIKLEKIISLESNQAFIIVKVDPSIILMLTKKIDFSKPYLLVSRKYNPTSGKLEKPKDDPMQWFETKEEAIQEAEFRAKEAEKVEETSSQSTEPKEEQPKFTVCSICSQLNNWWQNDQQWALQVQPTNLPSGKP